MLEVLIEQFCAIFFVYKSLKWHLTAFSIKGLFWKGDWWVSSSGHNSCEKISFSPCKWLTSVGDWSHWPITGRHHSTTAKAAYDITFDEYFSEKKNLEYLLQLAFSPIVLLFSNCSFAEGQLLVFSGSKSGTFSTLKNFPCRLDCSWLFDSSILMPDNISVMRNERRICRDWYKTSWIGW